MKLTITTNFPQVQASLDRLQRDVGQKALASALNKAIEQARTQMTREIPREFNVTAAFVRERLSIKRARAFGAALSLEATLAAGNGRKRSANIVRFLEKSVTLAQARKRAKDGTLNRLYVQVLRKGGRKPLGSNMFLGNKGRTVFKREGKARLPISPVQVIDIAQMFNTRRINRVVVDKLQQKLPEIFEREAAFYLARFNAGGRL